MSQLLRQIKTRIAHAKRRGLDGLTEREISVFTTRYQTLIRKGLRANRASPLQPQSAKNKGRLKQSPAKNLLDRLNHQQEAVLAFIHDFRIPFDNNQAERDIRMMKLKQKIAGCFRAEEGSRQFCRIRGYLSTLRKQDINALGALTKLFQGEPIFPVSLLSSNSEAYK